MSQGSEEFRERLLNAEKSDPARQEKYEEKVRAMIQKRLSTGEKVMYVGFLLLGLFFLVFFGGVAIFASADLPLGARAVFGVGALFGLAWTLLMGWILTRGTIDLKAHPTAMTGLSWAMVVLVVTWAMVYQGRYPDPITGVQTLLCGVAFLVMVAALMISNRVDQAALKTREKLLEIEYKVEELSERFLR